MVAVTLITAKDYIKMLFIEHQSDVDKYPFALPLSYTPSIR
jgi:hypothetical protein